MRRIGSRALQWPFKKKDVNAMVQNFERYQRVITDALQMDQTRLLQRNTRLMEQMTLQFAEKAPTKPPSPDLPAACFTIPFPRDPDFVDRSTLMQRLEDQYKGSRQRIALVGMGGFGKSQIAIEFAYRVRETISDAATSVFWVHGSTRARIEQSYRSLADLLEIPRRHEPGVSILTLVRDWLTGPKPGKWLMILDNADDVDVFFATDTAPSTSSASSHETHEPLAAYLPKTGDGKILVTTRSMNAAERLTGGHHSVIQIPTMGQAECLQLVHNNATFVYERTAAEELVQILELIPLAVTQAVAYINRRTPRQSIQSYIQNFRKNEARQGSLLNHDSGDLRRLESASNSIVVTWQITFEQIRRERPSSAELLSLMSFFHSQNIPEEVLQGYVGLSSRTRHDSSQREWSLPDDQSPGEPEANSDDGQLEDDLDALMGYSLIVPTTTLGFYDMHALVQFCTQKWLAEFGKPERWRKLFIRLAAINFPNGEFGTWERFETDELYAQTVSLMNEDQGEPSSFPLTCFDLACICYERGRSKDAAKWMQASVEFGLKANGEGHVDTQEAISTLAQWRREDDEMLSHGKLYGATVPDDIGGDSEAPSSISSIGDTA
ncbi:hypothetical protein D7B24_005797 [Verticillium nonalfalfae]|uniref:NB-ARC domain-containing protein n=1 Tax=Verticillium nonalfalfae TaxID=1051616 RepID=A0A3M9YAV6_9PEZI|nr:uncharacterized protein D7B24_005797 [Verticillium nonalfalfae]RNJ57579.1 hypothetical protein D7B24_005797 [Verticillium nonalfalfae]